MAGPGRAADMLRAIAEHIETSGIGVRLEFDAPPSEALGGDESVLVPLAFRCDDDLLRRLPSLRAIVVPTIGFDWVDIGAATARGIAVANTPVAENFESMAEAALLLILAASYQLREAEAHLREAKAPAAPRMLRGRTIGVIGYGRIARALIRRLRPFGVKILVHSRSRAAGNAINFVSLDELLTRSDVLVPLVSLDRDSEQLLDRSQLARLQRGAILVNVARGALVEEAALPEMISDGRLGYMALDVFETEPLPADSALRRLDRTIITPHSLGHTVEAIAAARRECAANVVGFLKGRQLRSRVA